MGQIVLSVALVVLVASLIAWNLPPGGGPASQPETSALRHEITFIGSPLLYALGLDQDWGVFAPPRTEVLKMKARISYADGTTEIWRPPTSTGALVGAYRDYRWGKLIENNVLDTGSSTWAPLAEWLAREHTSGARRVTQVELIRRYYPLLAVIKGSRETGPVKQDVYYIYRPPAGSR